MGLDHGFIQKRKGLEDKYYTFRKANHIHAYMINNFHNGIDDQKDFKVPISGIEEFQGVLKRVIKSLEESPKKTISIKVGRRNDEDIYRDVEVFEDTSVAEELLPTRSGFFFGSTEYDDWYLEQCKEALEMCNEIMTSYPKGTIIYWCWW
jgi:hypothetical protein